MRPNLPLITTPLALALAAATIAGCGQSPPESSVRVAQPEAVVTPVANPTPEPPTPRVAQSEPKPRRDGLVKDNGKTLWASPTDGEAIDLSVVPDASGLIVHLRPAALLASDEGRSVWRALGPAGEAARRILEAAADKPLDEIDTLVVGVTAGESYGEPATTVAIEPSIGNELPLLQREIELLLDATDAERHMTMVFSPRFLLGDGGALLQGDWAPLRELLLAQLRDEWKAAALSLHVDDEARLYWELRVLGTAASRERRMAKDLKEQTGGWTAELASVVEGKPWSPYSLVVVERSPRMLGVVGKYARAGVIGRQAVANGYAPPGAAHQLLLASERIVAELSRPVATGSIASFDGGREEATIAERLRRPVTVRFRRESLETAVGIVSDAIGVPIVIRGRDLQLEGITRNQMLALDVTDKPAAEALVEVVRLANPDPLAEGPADERQRLVFVVRGDRVELTTRRAAADRGDPLPKPFVE